MKSRIIGKKQILFFSLIIALGGALFINWYYTNNQNDNVEIETTDISYLGEAQYVNSNSVESSTDDYFKEARLKRTKAHDSSKSELNDIINSSNYDNETKKFAKDKLVNISEEIKLETDIENLITAQLGCDCLVTYNTENIEIILPQNVINDNDIIKVKNIVVTKTKLSSEQISIIELK